MKRLVLSLFLACLILAGLGLAQSVTTGTFSGSIVDSEGKALPGASIKAVHVPTGSVFAAVSRADGRFDILFVKVGGPYTVTADLTGFGPQTLNDISVRLGEVRDLKFTLSQARIEVGVTVTAPNPVISQSRTGASMNVGTNVIESLPTIGRTFDDFARMAPQVDSRGGGAFSAAGRSNKYNSIWIDGAVNNDLFGLSGSGSPGLAAPISLDAIQEFELVLAPYDVRYGGFTGAGLNAITRSGTNRITGSLYYYGRNEGLVGKGPDRTKYSDFSAKEFGLRVGGPIVRDKVYFFLSAEMGRRASPTTYIIDDSGNANDFGGANVSVADAQSFVDILKNTYGYDPGGFGAGYIKPKDDNDKVFFRLDFNLSPKHRLILRHNYINGYRDNTPSKASSTVFAFGDDFYGLASKTNSTVLQLQSTLSRSLYNELIVNYSTIRDKRTVPDTLFPQVNVLIAGGYRLTAGSEQYSGANSLNQDILEITDNLTWSLGKHMLTIGTHNEFFKFANVYIRNLYGYWEFSSLANLQNGVAARYYHDFYTADPAEKWAARFSVAQIGGYIGDKWSVQPNLTLTFGARIDIPFINKIPTANPAAEAAYGVKTDQVASGNVMFSPRFGFNWDVRGDRSTQVRGGFGLFSGRTPYVWISNQFSNTGIEFTRLDIRNPAFPFEPDPLGQPTGGTGLTSEVDLIDANFMYPQSLRASVAVDQELPFGIIGTVELVASKNVNEILYQNLNLSRLPTLTMGGRYLYARTVSPLYTDAIYLTNTGKGYQYSLSVQLQKNFSNRSWINAFYSYGQSKDVNSGTSSQASSNFAYNNIRYDVNQPELTWSNYDVRHRYGLAFSWQAKFIRNAPTTFSVFMGGRSGRPYSSTYNYFDANGDAATGNDLIYVPESQSEVVFVSSSGATLADQDTPWASFDAFISGDPGLDAYRGKIAPRNASREPGISTCDLRIAQDVPVPVKSGHRLQLTLDIVNLYNLIDPDKGLIYYVSNQNDTPWTLYGTNYGVDPATGQQRIRWTERPNRFTLSQLASRWQIQFGFRYSFD
jgi:hypothetical protein